MYEKFPFERRPKRIHQCFQPEQAHLPDKREKLPHNRRSLCFLPSPMHHFSKRRNVCLLLDLRRAHEARGCGSRNAPKRGSSAEPGRPRALRHDRRHEDISELEIDGQRFRSSYARQLCSILNARVLPKSARLQGDQCGWRAECLVPTDCCTVTSGRASEDRDLALARNPSQAWPRGPDFSTL